jgi:hypothetical protein
MSSPLIRTAVKDDNPAPNGFGPGLFVGYGRTRQTGARCTENVAGAPDFVLVLVVVFPTSPRRLKLREAMSGRLSSTGAHVITAPDRPSPGGEPLWRLSGEPAIFVLTLSPGPKCCNRRLPRTTQRDAFTLGFSIRSRLAHRAAERWVAPGSRLLPHVSARFVM